MVPLPLRQQGQERSLLRRGILDQLSEEPLRFLEETGARHR